MKISIITVTYNAEATIGRTMESVAQQTHPDVEHLIIDGASTDRTLDIARRYPHAIISSEPDKGLYDAMNKGLKKATGDYLCFLNAGDKLHSKETLAHIAASIPSPQHGNGVAILYGDTHIVDDEGNFLRNRRLTPPEHLTWRSFRQGMLVCHQAFYARTDIAKEMPYDTSYRFSADVDWCIRVMKRAQELHAPLCNADKVLALYLKEGQTTRNHRASLRERFQVMQHHYGLVVTVAMHLWFGIRALGKTRFFR